MKKERRLKFEEVCLLTGISRNTIYYWYKFQKEYPDTEFSKKLPPVEHIGPKRTRYWKESDVWKLVELKKNIVYGRHGIMGKVTQKYKKRVKEEGNAENI